MRPLFGSAFRAPVFCIYFLLPLSLFGLGRAEEPAPPAVAEEAAEEEAPAVQDLYTALDPGLPVMGWLTADVSWNIKGEEASHISSSFLEKVVRDGLYKPVSLMKWYEQEYSKNSPRDLLQILGDMKKQKMPVSCLCTLKVRPLSDNYLVVLGLYNTQNSSQSTYVHRILPDLTESWNRELPEICSELFLRYQKKQRPLFSKNIYFEPFQVRFFSYYELENKEFTFTEIPFRNIEGTDFKNDCDVVSDLLAMRLHSSGLAGITASPPLNLVKDEFQGRSRHNWGIRGEVRISEKINVFHLEIYNYKRKSVTAMYDIPFYGYDSHSLYRLTDAALPFILDSLLTENEKKQVVFTERPYINIRADRLYGSRGYLGPDHLIRTLVLPAGLSRLLLKQGGFSGDEVWNPGLFNAALLVNPSGSLIRTYTQKDILYAEKLFE